MPSYKLYHTKPIDQQDSFQIIKIDQQQLFLLSMQLLNELNEKIPEETTTIVIQTEKQQTNKKTSDEIQQDEQSITLVSTSQHNQERRYGNYISLVDNRYISLNLGPDYLCFIPTFLVFSFFAFVFATYINNNVKNMYVVIITHIVCIGQCVSYLLVGLSNPGIAHPLNDSQKLKFNKTSFCRKCRFDIPPSTFHCTYCDVCIIGYDHHCPWTSKCIGKNNLIRFYVFLFWTPVFIVYNAFIFGFTIDGVEKQRSHLTQVGK